MDVDVYTLSRKELILRAAGIGCSEPEAKAAMTRLIAITLSVSEQDASGYASLLKLNGLVILPAEIAATISSLIKP